MRALTKISTQDVLERVPRRQSGPKDKVKGGLDDAGDQAKQIGRQIGRAAGQIGEKLKALAERPQQRRAATRRKAAGAVAAAGATTAAGAYLSDSERRERVAGRLKGLFSREPGEIAGTPAGSGTNGEVAEYTGSPESPVVDRA